MTQCGQLEILSRELNTFVDERDWHQYHTPKNLAIALAVEVAEIMEIFQWLTAEQSINLDRTKKFELS